MLPSHFDHSSGDLHPAGAATRSNHVRQPYETVTRAEADLENTLALRHLKGLNTEVTDRVLADFGNEIVSMANAIVERAGLRVWE
jgi:hypothetical protein